MANKPVEVSGEVAGTDKVISFETGKLAGQANGAVVGRIGKTSVLVTATAASSVREGIDFFPLTVDIEERMYAAGKIPGSFFRREGRATDAAILTCRLIDRPLRPTFDDDYRNETHIVGTVLGVDMKNPHDVVAINAASAALSISGIPFQGPIGAVRVAYSTEGDWVPHCTYQEGEASTFEMVVAGRLAGDDVAIMMVEAGGTEKAWTYYEAGAPKVTEEVIADGLEAAKFHIRQSIELQLQMMKEAGVADRVEYEPQIDYTDEILAKVQAVASDDLSKALTIVDKKARGKEEKRIKKEVVASLEEEFADTPNAAKMIGAAVKSVGKEIMRSRVINEGIRIDGRGPTDLRELSAEVGYVPTAHGSGLFQRGETQVLNICTLGMPRMNQMLDTIDTSEFKYYMHHYNFPPYSTGETGFMRGPKRREIGHGLLAERALFPVVPSQEEFAYTLRCVSEVLSSNGSTSMASVCGSSLSLMDAGVPIKAPVAGIAMGLIYKDDKYLPITDILGAEDAMGDMDFKVAGTAEFVTALQLDTKIDGIPADVLAQALAQAKDARLKILDTMNAAISAPRDEVAETAPKIVSFEIPGDKIGEVIGPKGKVINTLQAETGADITVDDDGGMGRVSIGAVDGAAVAEARRQIELILNPPEAEVGKVYPGRVVNITKFGAFVNILPGRDGLLHISKIGGSRRIDRVEDELDLGDEIDVIVEDIDQNGKVSLKPANDDGGGDAPEAKSDGGSGGGGRDRDRGDRPERSDRGGRGRDRGERSSRDSGSSDSDDSDSGDKPETVSFEDSFEETAQAEFGDLGPADTGSGRSRDGGDRGGRGGGGGGRRRRR